MSSQFTPYAQWATVLSVPVFMTQSSRWMGGNSVFPLIVYTLLYPIILSTVTKSPSFHLADGLVWKASVATFFIWLLASYNTNVNNNLRDPEDGKYSWATYVGIISTFLASILSISYVGKVMDITPYN